ncbi:MAG: T9SS type A sorting domain-containing protein, partial [Calditrichaeota bacterium]|nr:T9SS type A sorting domain-containing protein [Calditrichota bacterium]
RPDGQAGAFVAWSDSRNGSIAVQVQRLDSLGAKCLSPGGIELVWGLDGDAAEPQSVPLDFSRVACVWKDSRLGVRGTALYFQIVDTLGRVLLTTNGLPVAGDIPFDVPANQQNHRVCPDGRNGFFVVWEDQRTGTKLVRAQHINIWGELQWSAEGMVVAPSNHDEDQAACAPDGEGGVYVGWSGRDTTWRIDIYVQRLNAAGQSVWAEPLRLQDTFDDDILFDMVSDGDGRAILVWEAGTAEESDIYGACISPDGSVAWYTSVCDFAGEQRAPAIAGDAAGGAYFAWRDLRNLADDDIYAQHINASGAALWAEDGLAICTETNDQVSPRLSADEDGNLFVTWEDYRNGVDRDLYIQKVSPTGVLQFPTSGLPVVVQNNDQYEVRMITEWAGGVYLVWTDIRSTQYPDIYGMHLNSDGENASTVNWPTGGIVVNESENLQHRSTIVHDGAAGATAFWQDWRASGKAPLINLWAQRLNDYTVDVPMRMGPAVPEGYALSAFPNPFNPITEIRFSLPRRDHVRLVIYDLLGRQVKTLTDEPLEAGSYRLRWNAESVASGLYFCRMETPHVA